MKIYPPLQKKKKKKEGKKSHFKLKSPARQHRYVTRTVKLSLFFFDENHPLIVIMYKCNSNDAFMERDNSAPLSNETVQREEVNS